MSSDDTCDPIQQAESDDAQRRDDQISDLKDDVFMLGKMLDARNAESKNLATERDRLAARLRRGELVVYQALQWMLDHGGAGDPLRIRLKNWRSGRPDDA